MLTDNFLKLGLMLFVHAGAFCEGRRRVEHVVLDAENSSLRN